MAGNDITQGSGEIFNAEKPSLLKRAFQVAGAALSTLTGDGTNYGFNQATLTYDYFKAKIGSFGAPKSPAAPVV